MHSLPNQEKQLQAKVLSGAQRPRATVVRNNFLIIFQLKILILFKLRTLKEIKNENCPLQKTRKAKATFWKKESYFLSKNKGADTDRSFFWPVK